MSKNVISRKDAREVVKKGFPKKKPITAPKPASTSGGSTPNLSYQSGYMANHQAVNAGQVKADYARNAQYQGEMATPDAQRGVQDLQNQMTTNTQGQMGRQLEAQNSQKFMQDQATRAELTQQGLANQTKIHSDLAQRSISQMGLSAKLQEAQVRNNFAIAQQQAQKLKSRGKWFHLNGAYGYSNDLMKKSLLQ